MATRVETAKPFGETDAGDLEPATGAERLRQRILRGLFTEPGELKHRPGWGAGLKSYQNKPSTRSNLQAVANDIARFLKPLEAVEAFRVEVDDDGDGSIAFSVAVEHDSGTFEVGEVSLADS